MKFQDTYSCICSHNICANACALHAYICYNIHECTRCLHRENDISRTRACVIDAYTLHPVCLRQTHNGSVVYTFTYKCTHKLMNVTILTRKNFPNSYSSIAGHQKNSILSRVSILFILSCIFIYKIQGFKYGGWGWTSRALPIRTCTSHNSLVTSTET